MAANGCFVREKIEAQANELTIEFQGGKFFGLEVIRAVQFFT